MSESPQLHTILCEEVFDENSVPSEEEVIDYAAKIGIDPKSEPHLLPIALNGLMHPLPPEWKPCFDSGLQKWYYFNTETKKSQWEHPLDSFYRQVVKRGRSEGYSSAGDDDSKTTAKEDLKSFEEASDILSSKSVDIKSDVAEENKEITVMNERGPLLKGSQPLLLRRKQLQSGQDPLHVAKLINSTLRQSLPKEDVQQRSSFSDLPMPTPALRRSHTSDVITPHPPPIKGILRESSFSGSMSSSARASSVKLGPLQGDFGGSQPEVEDEKKRSVRFADFERKSLDIRFQLSDSDETYSDVDEDDSASSGSADIEKDPREIKVENKPKMLSPLKTNAFGLNSSDFPRTRKFTVTPVKESSMGFPVSELKGLFRTDSVGPLDSDSDGSFGIKPADSLATGVSKDMEIENVTVKQAQAVSDLSTLADQKGNLNSESVRIKLSESVEKSATIKRVPGITSITSKHLESPEKEEAPEKAVESATDLTEFASALSLLPPESPDNLVKEKNERLHLWQQKLDEELKKQVEDLKMQQTQNLTQLKENLMKTEELEKEKLKEEFEERIKKLKEILEEEYIEKEKELRNNQKLKLEELFSELENQREKEILSLKTEHAEMLEKWKESQEEALREEKVRLDNESFESIQKLKSELREKLENLKTQCETEIEELIQLNEKRLIELKCKHEEMVNELNLKYQNEVKDIEETYRLKLEVLKKNKESELSRCEGEWEDKLTATSLSQKAQLESLEKEYEGRLARLKADWEREEAEMRKRRIPLEQQPLAVDYEKLRCEKRLLEDKYRSLKEKYVQLKSDMKIAVEKKLQARARRKREEMEKGETIIERPKNLNTELQPASLATPRITVGEVSPRDITDPSSDDQYTLSSNLPERFSSSKKGRSHRRDHIPTTRLNEPRSQIDEISGDIYLRHPLSSLGLSRSAEVDFYRQRLQAEEENVRTVRDNLDEQRRLMESRDTGENNNTFGLHQQERDLNDLEVSLHRTRALFGEKMIRLRLLGQTLSRLADDTTSPPSSGGELLSPTNVLQNLDNINAEIREIWNQLNKNQSGIAGAGEAEEFQKAEEKAAPKSSSHSHRPSKRSEIEARLQGLRDWLQKPPPPDWAQLTL